MRNLYSLPKIHKRLFDVPGRPVILVCDTSAERFSEFLDHHLKPLMQELLLYQGYWNFLKKAQSIERNPSTFSILVTDVTSLYPSIPYNIDLKVLKNTLDWRQKKNRYLFLLEICVTSHFVITDIHCNTCHALK